VAVGGGKSPRISVDGRIMVNDPDLAIRSSADALRISYTLEALAEPFPRSGPLMQVLENWSPSFRNCPFTPRAPAGPGRVARPHRLDPHGRRLDFGQAFA
jgi:hypothetical protein